MRFAVTENVPNSGDFMCLQFFVIVSTIDRMRLYSTQRKKKRKRKRKRKKRRNTWKGEVTIGTMSMIGLMQEICLDRVGSGESMHAGVVSKSYASYFGIYLFETL
jgi:hypothetical protein